MIIKNKYTKIYYAIIGNADNVKIKGETQYHHIIPESIGGSDDSCNRVHLTHKEHFVCHHLLTKMTTGEDWKSMVYAMHCMQADGRHQTRYSEGTARAFAENKKNYSKIASERMSGENNPQFGRVWTAEEKAAQSIKSKAKPLTTQQRKNLSQAMTGVKRGKFSDEWKANLSKNHASKQPGYDGSHSEETIAKIAEAAAAGLIGHSLTKEGAKKISQANLGKKREKKLCPNCNRLIAVNTYPRWHGDKCKER